MESLRNRGIIVTGGAAGLGGLVARTLGECGARVVIADQFQHAADATRRVITNADGQAIAVRADISQSHDVANLIAKATEWAGQLDVLVNCVMVPSRGLPVARSRASEIDRVLAVNVRGPFLCMRAFLNALLEQGSGGRIISVVSSAAREGQANRSLFAASQAAVIALMQSAAAEVAKEEILVNTICTPAAGAPQDFDARQVLDAVDTLLDAERDWRAVPPGEGYALGPIEMPEAVVAAVAFLASDRAGAVTGLTFGSTPHSKFSTSGAP